MESETLNPTQSSAQPPTQPSTSQIKTVEAIYLVILSAVLWTSIDGVFYTTFNEYSMKQQFYIYMFLFLLSLFLLITTHEAGRLFN